MWPLQRFLSGHLGTLRISVHLVFIKGIGYGRSGQASGIFSFKSQDIMIVNIFLLSCCMSLARPCMKLVRSSVNTEGQM